MKILFALCLLISQPANATDASKLKACDFALSSCEALVAEQDNSINGLKQQVKQLEGQIAKDEDKGLPVWVWIAIGVTGGAVVGGALHK